MLYPTRQIVDDYLDLMHAGACTYQCGGARDDVCVCRCGGEFHNLLRDWWASPECAATIPQWCVPCQAAHLLGAHIRKD